MTLKKRCCCRAFWSAKHKKRICHCLCQRKKYQSVKNAVLKVYELVAEAYRQHFRHWCKGDKQAHVDVVRELNTHFYRWLAAEGVSEFDALCDLIVLEQFNTIVPDRIATYCISMSIK